LEEGKISSRKAKFSEVWRILKARDVSIVQRSRAKWLKEGDVNSKFFHSCIKRRFSVNSIKALKVDERWVVSPTEVRKEVFDYFSNHVANPSCFRPKLEGVPFPSLTKVENGGLIAPFSLLEIEAVVKESNRDKSPGPDGLNFAFIKEFWYLIKNEVRVMFDQFHANGVLPRGM